MGEPAGAPDWRAELVRRLARLKMPHYSCDDPWYSCPKSSEGCANEFAGEECTCSTDWLNGKVEQIIAWISTWEDLT